MTIKILRFMVLVSLMFPGIALANELKPETLSAWDDYVQAAKTRLELVITNQEMPFLWIDADPERARRARSGEIEVAPAQKDNPKKIPHGLIHDWLGGEFMPNCSLDDVLGLLIAYDRYQEYYKPRIVKSKLLQDDGIEQKFLLVLMQKELGVTAAIDTDNTAKVIRIDDTHAYSYSSTTRVQAIDDFGKPTERELVEDTGPGYVWRIFTFSRLEQRDGGVYLETETMALSRGIPFEFRWLIKPLTERVPKATVALTLKQTRDAVAGQTKARTENHADVIRKTRPNY